MIENLSIKLIVVLTFQFLHVLISAKGSYVIDVNRLIRINKGANSLSLSKKILIAHLGEILVI